MKHNVAIRHPYIRFFLSSTFVDMEIERNIINDIFKNLSTEYSVRGWQIELVDLRWGISREAAKANRTIDICLEELRLCQELSPRPNFIALLGERYGWMPLIYSMNETSMGFYKSMVSPEDYEFVMSCYNFDANNKSDNESSYFLKEEAELGPDKLTRLQNIQIGVGYEVSATRIEVEDGLLSQGDCAERAIVYRRKFLSHSGLDEKVFVDENHSLQADLADIVEETVPGENMVKAEIYPADYFSEEYGKWFGGEMERQMRRLIEREIAYCIAHPFTENDLHIEFAEKNAGKFVDISSGIEEIKNYIENREEGQTPLWISGHPVNTGITKLLSKLVSDYSSNDEYDVIARFCGETEQSSDPISLMNSIFSEIKARAKDTKSLRSFESVKNDYIANRLGYPLSMWIGKNIKNLRADKRYLFVIDGLDIFRNNEFCEPEFFDLRWLSYDKLPPNVRIIVNTGQNNEYYLSPDFDLHAQESTPVGYPEWTRLRSDISIKGREKEFLNRYLELSDRTITDAQAAVMEQWYVKGKADRAMLSVLADEFALLHSYDKYPAYDKNEVPDINILFQCAVTPRMCSPKYHGKELFDSSVELLSFSPIGIPDSIMRDLLWRVENVRKYVEANMLHESDNSSLPAMFWSRLRQDFRNWLNYRYTAAGVTICLKHINLIDRNFYPDSQSLEILGVMLEYASENWRQQPWSLYIYPWLLYKSAQCRTEIGENSLTELAGLLKNPDYIANRYALDGIAICDNITKAISLVDSKCRGYESVDCGFLVRLRTQIMMIGSNLTADMFRLYALQQPDGTPLYEIFRGVKSDCLNNSLKDISVRNGVITQIGPGLKTVAAGNDGQRILLTDKRQTKAFIRNIYKGYDTPVFSTTEDVFGRSYKPALKFSADARLDCCAILHSDNVITVHRFDEKNSGRTSGPIVINSDGKVEWISLSPDHNWLVAGDKTKVRIWQGPELRLQFSIDATSETAFFSQDTRYLWIQFGTRLLRCGLPDMAYLSVDLSLLPKPAMAEDGEQWIYRLVFANDDVAVVMYGSTIIPIRIVDKKWRAPIVINNNENWVIVNVLIPDSEPDRLYIFFANGKWVKYKLFDSDISCVSGSNYNFDLVTSDLNVVVSNENGLVFNFRESGGIDYTIPDFHKSIMGMNNIASDYSGTIISITKGCNYRLQSYSFFNVVRSENKEWKLHNLPVEGLIAFTSAVAPDGSRLAVSSTNLMVYDGDDLKKINETRLEYMCNVMSFTSDSRWIVVADGDYLTSGQETFIVYDRNGNHIRTFSTGLIGSHSGNPALITPDNRFILTNGEAIIDLVDECQLMNENEYDFQSDQHFFTEVDIRQACWLGAISPDGNYVYSKFGFINKTKQLCRLDLRRKQLEQLPTDMSAVAISPDGKLLYVRDEKYRLHTLLIKDMSVSPTKLSAPVCKVYPTPDGKYLFAVTYDGFILFCDVEGNVLERAVLRGSFFTLCAKGLIAGQANGSFYLFEPSPSWDMNRKVFAPAVHRYDLATKTRESELTIVCPVCGYVHIAKNKNFNCAQCGREITVVGDQKG